MRGSGSDAATLLSIAEALGLHPSTVSRVINGTPAQAERAAGRQTRQRILDLAKELHYSPNPWGTSLRTKRSGLIGVLVPRLQDYVLATIYEGIQEAAAERGYYTLVTNTMDDPHQQRVQLANLLAQKVDGVIIGDSRTDSTMLDELDLGSVPVVLVNRRHNDLVAVVCDDYLGGRLVGEHLLRIGRARVGVLAGADYATTAQDRARGLVDVFAEAGITVPVDDVIFVGFDASDGRRAAEILLGRGGPAPDAIFAANDFAAIATLGVLRDHGLRVPEDVVLVGYNDVDLVRELPVPLTTVRSPMHEMGRRGLLTLVDAIDGHLVSSQMLAPTLVVRASTDVTR